MTTKNAAPGIGNTACAAGAAENGRLPEKAKQLPLAKPRKDARHRAKNEPPPPQNGKSKIRTLPAAHSRSFAAKNSLARPIYASLPLPFGS